jgi:hypothetical protein
LAIQARASFLCCCSSNPGSRRSMSVIAVTRQRLQLIARALARPLKEFALPLLPRRPSCLHHRRQFPPHSRAHRLASSGLLLGGLGLRWSSLTLLLCPPRLLCGGDSGTCGRAHATPFLACRLHQPACLRWAATACGLGTRSYESCNRLLDTACFLSKLCHYAFNVHVVLSI